MKFIKTNLDTVMSRLLVSDLCARTAFTDAVVGEYTSGTFLITIILYIGAHTITIDFFCGRT